MKPSSSLLIAILVLIAAGSFASSSAVPSAQDSPGAPSRLTLDQLREDFQIARHALEEGHSGIYRYTSKADMDRIFDAAGKSLEKPMAPLDFYRVLAPTVASIKCGHTSVVPPEETRQE